MAFTKITAAGIGSTETVTLDGVAVINNESIGGNLTVTGNATIGGVLTYEDVTNVDSVGIVTARGGIKLGAAGIGGTFNANGDTTLAGVVTATSFVGDVFADNIRLGAADAQTVDTSTGNLQLSASSGTVNAISDVFKVSNKTDLVGNIHVGSGGNKLFVNGSNGRVGIGTSVPTEEFQIIKDSGSLTVDLVSRTGGVTLGIGQSVGADGNATATFQHNASDLDITNRATGNVNVTLAGGTGINTTAFLHVQHGTTKRVSIGYSGVVGINKALPDHALDIVGSAKVTGNANFTGIVTMGSGGNQVTFGSGTAAVTGSFNGPLFSGVTGVSTIHRLEGNHIAVASTISTLGIGSFATTYLYILIGRLLKASLNSSIPTLGAPKVIAFTSLPNVAAISKLASVVNAPPRLWPTT